ncbi:MAG: hypothetical protein GXP16_18485 [Gammaproteobacteria bacterium]|nr:hypothetical protein [Gammaproteobacteria bacterium]
MALTNTGETSIEEIAALALRLAYEARAGVTNDGLTNNNSTGRPHSRAALATTRDPGELEALAGVYSTVLGDFEIRRHRDGLRTERLMLGSSVELRPSVGDLFRPRFRIFDLIPYSPSELNDLAVGFGRVGEVDTLFFDEGGQNALAGWRISPSPASVAWRARIGRYEIANLGSDFAFITGLELNLTQDRLRVTVHSDDWPVPPLGAYLETLTDDEACTWSLGGSICIYAYGSGDEVELELSGYRLRLAK